MIVVGSENRVLRVLAVAWTLFLTLTPAAQTATTASLPPQLRPIGEQLLDRTRSEASRVDAALDLGEDAGPATISFLAAVVRDEPSSQVRRAIIGLIAQSRQPEATAILRSLATAERGRDTSVFLDDQIQTREEAASEDFFRSVPTPPVEHAPVEGDSARFLVIGDFGTSERGADDMQEQVAAAMKRFQLGLAQDAAQFGVTVGDNFYPLGVSGPKDERWGHDWESVYGGLGLKFFAALGNHDHYGGSSSTKGQVTHASKSWRMAAQYYSVKAGVADLFVIDTQKILGQQSQMEWLERVLSESKAQWKVVVGHHPVISGGKHGINGELQDYREKLLPVLRRHDVELYLAGHDHDMQMLRVDGQYQAIVGSSGRDSRKVVALDESFFCSMSNGFAFIEATKDRLRVRFLRAPDAQSMYDCSIARDRVSGRLVDKCAVACQ